MLATICDDTWNVFNIQHLTPKDGIIQTPLVAAQKGLKDPLTWFKVATALKKPPTPPTSE